MKRIGFGAFSLLLASFSAQAAEGCFETHLREAIDLNHARAPMYSELTHGRSKKVTNLMVVMEKLSILPAKIFQWSSSSYQKKGIPLLCEEFIPMSLTPPFSPGTGQRPIARFEALSGWALMRKLESAYQEGGFAFVHEAAEKEIQTIAEVPEYHCLRRHFLESIARAAWLAPQYETQALKKGLKSPAGISWRFIQTQIAALPYAAKVDRAAAPIQAEGIPIVCQDVPPIPTRPILSEEAH